MLLCLIICIVTTEMLRGTLSKRDRAIWNQRPTLQNQINALRSKVNSQKPETQYFRVNGSHTCSTANSVEVIHHDVTQSLINLTTFRDLINGDQWKNKFLKVRVHSLPNCRLFRMVIYVPKRAGITFSPTSSHFASIPDPSSFWVIYDKTITRSDVDAHEQHQAFANLKNVHTLYDSNAARVNKGEIYVTLMSTSAQTQLSYNYGYELGFSNV